MTRDDELRLPTPPEVAVPIGACDAHTHVFSGAASPAVPSYPLPDAPIDIHRAAAHRLGIDRGVLVQPAVYGDDHGAMIAALQAFPTALRGVGLCPATVSDQILDALHDAGVRALRFVEMRVPGTGRHYPGSVSIDDLTALRPRLEARGWHAEIWAAPATCAAIARTHASDAVPLVFDHLAGATVGGSPNDPDYRSLLTALRGGRIWVKLSICRIGPTRADYPHARSFHEALVAANPARLIWGSDFPFVRKGVEAPDAGWLLDRCRDWTSDDALFRQILVTNPANLYDFEGPST